MGTTSTTTSSVKDSGVLDKFSAGARVVSGAFLRFVCESAGLTFSIDDLSPPIEDSQQTITTDDSKASAPPPSHRPSSFSIRDISPLRGSEIHAAEFLIFFLTTLQS